MPVDSEVIRKLSDENKAFQDKFNKVAGIIKDNQRDLEGVNVGRLDPDQKLALKCLKSAGFDLDKAINTFMIKKVDELKRKQSRSGAEGEQSRSGAEGEQSRSGAEGEQSRSGAEGE